MKFGILFSPVLLATLSLSLGVAAVPAQDLKTIAIRVVDDLGKPVEGADITLVELARYNIEQRAIGKTNARGQIQVFLANKEETEHGEPYKGWGVYRIVVAKRGYAWQFSGPISHWAPGPEAVATHRADDRREPGERNSAWSIGQAIDLRNRNELDLQFRLTRGATLSGVVRDTKGRPIRNAGVNVHVDLEAESRTGFGGELDFITVRSDASGHFKVANLGDFIWWVNASHPRFPFQTQTREDDRGIPVRITGGKDQQLKIILAASSPNKYYGTVRDANSGALIKDARVTLTYSFSTRGYPYEDTQAITAASGRFEHMFEYPHVYMISADASGYRPAHIPEPEREYYPPGEYNFKLHPLPANSPKYYGVVRDRSSGAPIKQVEVIVCYHTLPEPSAPRFCTPVKTDSQGKFECVVEHPYVSQISVFAGLEHKGVTKEEKGFFAPGEYNFDLEKTGIKSKPANWQ